MSARTGTTRAMVLPHYRTILTLQWHPSYLVSPTPVLGTPALTCPTELRPPFTTTTAGATVDRRSVYAVLLHH
jgi:hypothetical protein